MTSKRMKLLSVIAAFMSLFIIFIQNKTYEDLLEIDKCPFCFGHSVCKNFTRNEITVNNYVGLFKLMVYVSNVLGISNVIYASSIDKEIVVKKLAYKWDLKGNDEVLFEKIRHLSEEAIVVKMKQHLYVPFRTDVIKNIRLCPTVDKFDLLYKMLNISEGDLNKITNLWFTLNENPEPFIQKILSEENGWPVPKYLGSCGRAVISEYCGDMLTDRVQDPWNARLDIARQLLKAAFNFTFNHPSFAFYLTDITPDNIAVSPQGKITFIDLDNIIIVDKYTTADFVPYWNETHSTANIDCDNCFAFNSDDICSHTVSDHNIYAVCREILSPRSYLIDGGLLHSPPNSFLKSNPQFWAVILHCVQPVDQKNRFYFAKKLLRILDANSQTLKKKKRKKKLVDLS